MPSANSSEFLERLQRYPELQAKFDALLDVVENAAGDATKADEAEQRVFEELRQMGQQAIQAWAERKQQRIETACDARSDLARKEKKASLAHPLRPDPDSRTNL
jgi:transcriptional regulator GlxA family with amidase domain